MASSRLSVEGPAFAQAVKHATKLVDKLEINNWDFALAPELYAKQSRADVLAKELVFVHDGRQQTIYGRLVTGGFGETFNLMGPIHANAEFRLRETDIFDQVHRHTGTKGLSDLEEFRALPPAQPVHLYNYTYFFTLRDLIFWHALHNSGSYPSTLEHMARNFPMGKVIQNSMYSPPKPSSDDSNPAIMTFDRLTVTFPTPHVEWMEQPLFGGLVKETIQVEYLVTPDRSTATHPYLPLVNESAMEWKGSKWNVRVFSGVTPKDAQVGPGYLPEGGKRADS
ncbi:MAG: hypothetical protein JO197_18115 [Acidobacteria bacterium]|nr:hypothetical protein [Acidobacteriota bacterium]MBV9479021.1 hypothetical protein [Acidobacteriota bacterium]